MEGFWSADVPSMVFHMFSIFFSMEQTGKSLLIQLSWEGDSTDLKFVCGFRQCIGNAWYWAKTKDPHNHQHCTFSCSICFFVKNTSIIPITLQPQSSVGKNITSIILTNINSAKQMEHHFFSDATFCFSSHFEIKLLCCDNICQW